MYEIKVTQHTKVIYSISSRQYAIGDLDIFQRATESAEKKK